jgi:hypothetical protein
LVINRSAASLSALPAHPGTRVAFTTNTRRPSPSRPSSCTSPNPLRKYASKFATSSSVTVTIGRFVPFSFGSSDADETTIAPSGTGRINVDVDTTGAGTGVELTVVIAPVSSIVGEDAVSFTVVVVADADADAAIDGDDASPPVSSSPIARARADDASTRVGFATASMASFSARASRRRTSSGVI